MHIQTKLNKQRRKAKNGFARAVDNVCQPILEDYHERISRHMDQLRRLSKQLHPCYNPEEFEGYVDGELDKWVPPVKGRRPFLEGFKKEIESHTEKCDACRTLLCDMIRSRDERNNIVRPI